MIVGTQIIADRPTIRGNIYPREVLDKVIEDFNIEAKHKKIKGSILNRTHIEKNGEYTHYVKSLFINDSGVLCADIEFLNTEAGSRVQENIKKNNAEIVARPVMSIPTYLFNGKEKDNGRQFMVSEINKIMKVQIEYNCKEISGDE